MAEAREPEESQLQRRRRHHKRDDLAIYHNAMPTAAFTLCVSLGFPGSGVECKQHRVRISVRLAVEGV